VVTRFEDAADCVAFRVGDGFDEFVGQDTGGAGEAAGVGGPREVDVLSVAGVVVVLAVELVAVATGGDADGNTTMYRV
jgi:hypothetical protein